MMPLRKWKTWLKWSLFLGYVYIMWVFLRYIILSSQNDAVEENLFFDHWGPDESDIQWLQNIKTKDGEETPVVIVEEHHEVLKYWFQAADLNYIPKSRNVLIHIDGHSDGALPLDPSIIPWFRYPRSPEEIHAMMQRNDVFIIAAVLAGLIDHVIWIWPDWDEENHGAQDWSHKVFDVRMGYLFAKSNLGNNRDLCACWTVRVDIEKSVGDTKQWECRRQNFNSSDLSQGPPIAEAECLIQSEGVLEIISESLAANVFKKMKFLTSKNIILDIDEDFFGCWSDVIPLYESGISQSRIDMLSEIISDLLCAATAEGEKLADDIYGSFIAIILKLKSKSCDLKRPFLQHDNRNCMRHVEIENLLIDKVPDLVKYLLKDYSLQLCDTDEKVTGLLVQTLLQFLLNFSLDQLRLLSQLGICFNMSPSTQYFPENFRLHVCHGDNIPNKTEVNFHLPVESEIKVQSTHLKNILISLVTKPKLVTVCRSVRDGYTPKEFFYEIESCVMKNLLSSYRSVHKDDIHYDGNLLGGRMGWPNRIPFHIDKLLNILLLS